MSESITSPGGSAAEAQVESADNYMQSWLRSLRILHTGHWNAARHYDNLNVGLGLATAVTAAISGTTTFTQLSQPAEEGNGHLAVQVCIGIFALAAASLGAVQAFFRSSELAARHKQAAQKFGKLRRELEELLNLGLPPERDKREQLLTGFRDRWNAADEESLAVPQRIYDQAKADYKHKSPRA